MLTPDKINGLSDLMQQLADEASEALQDVMDDVMVQIREALEEAAEQGLVSTWTAEWEPYTFHPALRLNITYATPAEYITINLEQLDG